jgi:hypothetical protein
MRVTNTEILGSAIFATLLTFAGWLARANLRVDAPWPLWIIDLLNFPGGLFAVILAAIVVPEGIHNVEAVGFVVYPANWVSYFFLAVWFFSRRAKRAKTSVAR